MDILEISSILHDGLQTAANHPVPPHSLDLASMFMLALKLARFGQARAAYDISTVLHTCSSPAV